MEGIVTITGEKPYSVIEWKMNTLLISAEARKIWNLDRTHLTEDGHVIIADIRLARAMMLRLQTTRIRETGRTMPLRAGEFFGIGLLHEVYHALFRAYRRQKKSTVFQEAWDVLQRTLPRPALVQVLQSFVTAFPPESIVKGETSIDTYLHRVLSHEPMRQKLLEELILLWMHNENPALTPYRFLFDDRRLRKETHYGTLIGALKDFFETQPQFGPHHQNLMEMLATPARKFPHSLGRQLQYIIETWGELLPDRLSRLLQGVDFIREEEKARGAPGMGPGPVQVPTYGEETPEQFSPDLDWMPQVILMAKNTLVWLDQLSRKYKRSINRLDQIPDEELDLLARWGFTGLWLIGLWDRSRASKRIKQLSGNPEAEASAYAIYDYVIQPELGGEEALENLKQRCRARGIRLAGDMVPNHTGIDARWVIEHPDWYIQVPKPPFPSYTFNGPNLSEHPEMGLYIEDHYYDRSDAAVVFKWIHFRTGEVRYIYHGNDGTSIPWNDTAQLNYLLPEVREAVIQQILKVARRFPIIRFDAAMTLTKKHFQRLWFPEPGSGGDIPSRSEFGMSREAFDRRMPREFWREVVDRVAREAPDTLLLAEAFWLMESYFVRTLGMHRVYNSAFMNMLKNEDNAKFRELLKNTLAFDPEILKRYVHFMSNPDEETAVVQFGKGDKYFGVCTLMVTLPGLPLFGHGQIEGSAEKYGMEFRRAYWDEKPDAALIARHEREIFPLMRRRHLFAGVENFYMYDVIHPDGGVLEDVFAYSNRYGKERVLVVYNNRFAQARGWIRASVPKAVKRENGQSYSRTVSLAEGLHLAKGSTGFVIFRDHVSGLEYIRSLEAIWTQGLYVELDAYKYMVLWEFREVLEEDGVYSRLHETLAGKGVPSIEEALREMFLKDLHAALIAICRAGRIQGMPEDVSPGVASLQPLNRAYYNFLEQLKKVCHYAFVPEQILSRVEDRMKVFFAVLQVDPFLPDSKSAEIRQMKELLAQILPQMDEISKQAIFLTFSMLPLWHRLKSQVSVASLDELWHHWVLFKPLQEWWTRQGWSKEQIDDLCRLLEILLRFFSRDEEAMVIGDRGAARIMLRLVEDSRVRAFLRVHSYQHTLWFYRESYERLIQTLWILQIMEWFSRLRGDKRKLIRALKGTYRAYNLWMHAEVHSRFHLAKLVEALEMAADPKV